ENLKISVGFLLEVANILFQFWYTEHVYSEKLKTFYQSCIHDQRSAPQQNAPFFCQTKGQLSEVMQLFRITQVLCTRNRPKKEQSSNAIVNKAEPFQGSMLVKQRGFLTVQLK
ncbi:hypothetical protein XENOCAPTIV_002333, partial [Xenoophorus captivus]